MTKRREVVRFLERHGFESRGGTNHEKFVHPDGRVAIVPRHREIKDRMFEIIKRQAGLR
ncbi:type II toxin-antitoxin system HicA family toxin [Collinsella sp. AF08-23]|uniref:type II toxin-antitoxin system HicA family toxin n=1 Tax=Collinsella sp. AF08-23 TaxID=2292211 RepID=UPI000E4A046E|nr:type II toxin-antitoxin system HicA family toxin [Collinsella sp. AF08-23]RHS40817.1 type II toxin-antitoxin system HicA family toxin [Collinsella sp. AF08-23]